MNIIEFTCDLCSNRFHELQGAKCIECNKLVCPDCQNKYPKGVICIQCKRLFDLEQKKHEKENIKKSTTNKTELDYDEMKHRDRLIYDKEYLHTDIASKKIQKLDKIRKTLILISLIFPVPAIFTFVIYNLYINKPVVLILGLVLSSIPIISFAIWLYIETTVYDKFFR